MVGNDSDAQHTEADVREVYFFDPFQTVGSFGAVEQIREAVAADQQKALGVKHMLEHLAMECGVSPAQAYRFADAVAFRLFDLGPRK